MSIGRAQALALREKFLDDIGVEKFDTSTSMIDTILGEVGQELINTAVANLDKTGSHTTGELATSLTLAVEMQGEAYVLAVGYPKLSKAALYWDFNNKGVQGVNLPGRAPNSPYKFRYLGVSRRHALAILKWYRESGRQALNIHKDHPVGNVERKHVSLRETIKKTDDLTSLAYATAAKMKRDGLKPSNYFDYATNEVFGPDLLDTLAVSLGTDIIISIANTEKI